MQPDIAGRRLVNQRLVGRRFETPKAVVRWFGAVQSQDYSGAKWGIAQRASVASDAGIDRLFDNGKLLRTHVLRPTWHFVVPEDIRWMLGLTGPRVLSGAAGRLRRLELTPRDIDRACKLFAAALEGGNQLTRSEIGQVLRKSRLSPDGQRLPHLLLAAELTGVIVSGPRRGKQFTYALIDERAPTGRAFAGMDAAVELARRYFQSHGPAQLHDFTWWSGLTLAMAREAVAAAGSALSDEVIGGKRYYDTATSRASSTGRTVHLLPNFDEYTVAYRDREEMVDAAHGFDPDLFAFRSMLSNVVTVRGRIRGSWRRVETRGAARLAIRLQGQFDQLDERDLAAAVAAYQRFLGRPVELTVEPGRSPQLPSSR